MANIFLDTNWISMDVLRLLTNELTVAEYFNMNWDKDFKKEFPVGSSIQVKFPQTFTIRYGTEYNPQGINRISTTINLDRFFGVDFQWDDFEAAIKAERSEEEIREQYLDPISAQLAQEVDSQCAYFAMTNASNVVGSLGTDPTSLYTYDQARARLEIKAVPPGKRSLCLSSSMLNSIGPQITTLFNPADEVDMMFRRGILGTAKNFDWYESQSLYSFTAGTFASGAVTVVGGGQSGSSLVITGSVGDTLGIGDKISLANVNMVNPRTRRITGPPTAQQFTLTAPWVATGGNDTINVLPVIYGPGNQYQNVDNLPVNGAAVTLWPGTASPNGAVGTLALGLTKYAFALVGAKLYSPKRTEITSQKQDKKTGLAVRYVKDWNSQLSMQINRFDMAIGMGNLYQDNGCVLIAGQ